MTQTRKLPPERVTSLLEHWARLGASILAGKQVRDVNWTPVQRLLEAACPLFCLETQKLCDLLEKSNRHLHPFEDPLRVILACIAGYETNEKRRIPTGLNG